jgi:hypothetical protein
MPSFAWQFDNDQIAAITTYIRNAFSIQGFAKRGRETQGRFEESPGLMWANNRSFWGRFSAWK